MALMALMVPWFLNVDLGSEIEFELVSGEKQKIHSESIRLKMQQIHECHSLSSQLEQAESAELLKTAEK